MTCTIYETSQIENICANYFEFQYHAFNA